MRFSGGGNLLSSNNKGFDDSTTTRQASLSLREAKGTDEVTSRVTLLAELRDRGEGAILSPVKNSTLAEGTTCIDKQKRVAFTSPSRGMSEAKVEQQSTETLSFRCWCERCRLTRGRIDKPKRTAFTLAEVLITLGIIGVVAALTLPALLVKTKTSEYSARLKKFYSTMNQAIKMSELDNGPCEYWDYEKLTTLSNGADSSQDEKDSIAQESADKATVFLDKYIRPYVKGEKSENFNWVTTIPGFEIKAPGIKFPDGSAMYAKTGNCFDLAFDANGSAPPNERGKDQFVFLYCNKENNYIKGQCFTPYWNKYTKSKPREYWVEQCKTQPYSCSALLFIDGWEFKKDYPYKVK